jgi:DNA modification methylase
MNECVPLDDPLYPPHEPVPWKRREQIGLATLYLGDCREIAPTLPRPAAVISDPPYGIGVDRAMAKASGTKHGVALAAKRHYEAAGWDDATPPAWFVAWLAQAADAVVLFGGNYFGLPASRCWLVWDKQNGANEFADCELAWTNLDKPVRRVVWMWNGMLRKGGEERGPHPTQKPVGVMRWCIEQAKVPAGGAILDPYMGSGSTGVAAAQMRHPFIGIEIEPRYFDVACRRIEQAQRQGDLLRDVVA